MVWILNKFELYTFVKGLVGLGYVEQKTKRIQQTCRRWNCKKTCRIKKTSKGFRILTKLQEQEKLVKEIYRLRLELYLKFKKPYGNKGYDNWNYPKRKM